METPPEPEMTTLLLMERRSRGGELLIRTVGEPAEAMTSLKAAVSEVFPGVPIRRLRTMEDVVADQVTWRRFDMWIVDLFAVLGLVIAAVGIFGTLACGVERRTREIGVRMALGATVSGVRRLIASETAWALGIGLAIGAIAARWLLAGFESQWFEVTAGDPWSFAVAALVLSLAALLASIVPARRALDVSPAAALRAE